MFGFNLAKFKLELILAGLVLAICTGVYLNLQYKSKKIEKLQETVVAQKIENGGLKVDNAVKDGVIEVNEAVNIGVKKQADNIVAKSDKIQKKTDRKVQMIEDMFDTKPSTPENLQAKAESVSQVIIEGVWEQYCLAAPENPKCNLDNGVTTVSPDTIQELIVHVDVSVDVPEIEEADLATFEAPIDYNPTDSPALQLASL